MFDKKKRCNNTYVNQNSSTMQTYMRMGGSEITKHWRKNENNLKNKLKKAQNIMHGSRRVSIWLWYVSWTEQ